MDWTPYISGILVLIGTGIGVFGSIVMQLIIQRNENARHLRKIAYEAAMLEWKTCIENGINTDSTGVLKSFDVIKLHFATTGHLSRFGTSQENIDSLLGALPAKGHWRDVPRKEDAKVENTAADNHAEQGKDT
jgi:hypothetical protein